MRLLLVEDDNGIALEVKKALQREAFDVCWKASGQGAIDACAEFDPSLVILDLGLPDMDGVDVLKILRKQYGNLPILILTARDEVGIKVKALDQGADDYLTKPFDMSELLARLRVLARRLSAAVASEIIIANVNLNLAGHKVCVDDKPITLSRRELKIMVQLMENADRIQTKEAIESRLYGLGEEVSSNAIEVHISNIRKKLPVGFIQTVRGVGYLVSKSFSSSSTE